MANRYPQEFRDDVVAIARGREAGVSLQQIADDFGVSKGSLKPWLRQAGIEEGGVPGTSREQAADERELRKRIRLLEQENEILRRAAAYLSQANLKLGGS
ncbi:transposase, partial [Gryllotalpicola sp.]|uniref:transposase n=1 Tax=Gryllotalpicola sp. TaxID=1932787 RepID=UPI00261A1BF1